MRRVQAISEADRPEVDVHGERGSVGGKLPPAQPMRAPLLVAHEEYHDGAESDHLRGDVAGWASREEAQKVVDNHDQAERTSERNREVGSDEHHECDEQEIEDEIESRDKRHVPGGEEAGDMVPALVVTLRPACPLPQPGTHRAYSLLGDRGRPAETDLPAEAREVEAEVEILCEAVCPRWSAAERSERLEASELTVPPRPTDPIDRAPPERGG